MSISIYDPTAWDNQTPRHVLGGKRRAATGERDSLGRFLPKDDFLKSMWQLDAEHGRRGGLKILEKYGREYYARIAKLKRKQS